LFWVAFSCLVLPPGCLTAGIPTLNDFPQIKKIAQ
jgi:hypothetical protein